MKKAFRLLGKTVVDKIEENGFAVELEEDGVYRFGRYSSAGQDFGFSIDIGESPDEFVHNVLKCYNDFDVSYETYLWLDDTGHGRNGAPYDMKDVYEDMEECRSFIYELYKLVRELI